MFDFQALKYGSRSADNKPDAFENRGHMKLRSDKKFFKHTQFVVLSISGLIVVAACAYSGFNISGIGGAAFGVFFGLTICGC